MLDATASLKLTVVNRVRRVATGSRRCTQVNPQAPRHVCNTTSKQTRRPAQAPANPTLLHTGAPQLHAYAHNTRRPTKCFGRATCKGARAPTAPDSPWLAVNPLPPTQAQRRIERAGRRSPKVQCSGCRRRAPTPRPSFRCVQYDRSRIMRHRCPPACARARARRPSGRSCAGLSRTRESKTRAAGPPHSGLLGWRALGHEVPAARSPDAALEFVT